MKHPLPETQLVTAGNLLQEKNYYHKVIHVGLAFISTYINDSRIRIELIDSPDSFFYELAFAQIPPVDRSSFLYMMDLIGQVSPHCVYRVETLEIAGDVDEAFEKTLRDMYIANTQTNFRLYLETYGRN